MKYIKFFENTEEQEYSGVKGIIDDYLENNPGLKVNFSFGRYYKQNYHADIRAFKSYMKSKNIDFDRFIKMHRNRVFSDEFFVETSGFLDALLYEYDKNYPIGGNYELIELEKYNPVCEHIMKYDYGYHTYELGKNYILQTYDTLNDFFFACAQWKHKELFDSDYSNLLGRNDWDLITGDYDFAKNYEKFLTPIKLSEGALCFVNLKKMFDITSRIKYFKEFAGVFIKHTEPQAANIEEGWCAFYFGFIEINEFLSNVSIDINNPDINKINRDIEVGISAAKFNL